MTKVCQTSYNRLENQNGVVVSTRNLSMQVKTGCHSLRSSLVVPVASLALLGGCSFGPDIDEVPSPDSRVPVGTVPAELPRPPVPDVIPGLQQGAENSAVATVTPVAGQGDLQSRPILGGIAIDRGSITDPQHPLSQRIVFFGYNSSQLTPEGLDLIRGHAEYLSRFSDVRVRVEGHTDERGSREYNIALGDNRARSVAKILELGGADPGQFSTLSYGEEVPIDEGSNDRAWRRNRRVEVVYEGYN